MKLSAQQLAIVCELLLRGPQTPGELRSRASRMAPFADVSEVEAALQSLLDQKPQPLLARLAREPGRRESRYMHLFGGPPPLEPAAQEGSAPPAADRPEEGERLASRMDRLEEEVRLLRQAFEELKSQER